MTTYKVVEYVQGSLPITVDALPEDVIQGEKIAKLLELAIGKFRRNGKVTLETRALGPIVFWETRARAPWWRCEARLPLAICRVKAGF